MMTDPNVETIKKLVQHTAASLGKSFANYWPVNGDKPDPAERNVSLHFAHAMLSAQFSTFGEVHHSDRAAAFRIDVFGLAPDNSWFLGCEFKKLYNGEKLQSLANDIKRLSSFRPRTEYALEKYGLSFSAAASACKQGYGLVGGLHWWSKRSSSLLYDVWAKPERHSPDDSYGDVVKQIRAANAVVLEPPTVISFPRGKYVLLAAVFPIEVSKC